jgi:PhnB protein
MAFTPYLLYEDVGDALKFLSKAFGFKKEGPAVKGPNGKINHAAMKLGKDLIMMGCPGPQYKNPKNLGQKTQYIYIDIDDVDKHFARAKKAGAAIIEEPTNTPYGARRYGAQDPEGHGWFFAHELKKSAAKKRGKGK